MTTTKIGRIILEQVTREEKIARIKEQLKKEERELEIIQGMLDKEIQNTKNIKRNSGFNGFNEIFKVKHAGVEKLYTVLHGKITSIQDVNEA